MLRVNRRIDGFPSQGDLDTRGLGTGDKRMGGIDGKGRGL
jgi:hypothetical protein